jgi:hypothetical protein
MMFDKILHVVAERGALMPQPQHKRARKTAEKIYDIAVPSESQIWGILIILFLLSAVIIRLV